MNIIITSNHVVGVYAASLIEKYYAERGETVTLYTPRMAVRVLDPAKLDPATVNLYYVERTMNIDVPTVRKLAELGYTVQRLIAPDCAYNEKEIPGTVMHMAEDLNSYYDIVCNKLCPLGRDLTEQEYKLHELMSNIKYIPVVQTECRLLDSYTERRDKLLSMSDSFIAAIPYIRAHLKRRDAIAAYTDTLIARQYRIGDMSVPLAYRSAHSAAAATLAVHNSKHPYPKGFIDFGMCRFNTYVTIYLKGRKDDEMNEESKKLLEKLSKVALSSNQYVIKFSVKQDIDLTKLLNLTEE